MPEGPQVGIRTCTLETWSPGLGSDPDILEQVSSPILHFLHIN